MDKFYAWLMNNDYGHSYDWNGINAGACLESESGIAVKATDLMLIGYKLKYLYENGHKDGKYYIDDLTLDSLIKEINNAI